MMKKPKHPDESAPSRQEGVAAAPLWWKRVAPVIRALLCHPALWLFGVALFTKLIVLVDYYASPFFGESSWDAEVYVNWAKSIAAGNLLGTEVFHRSPLYPYVLALTFRIFGESHLPVYLVQIALGALTSVLVFFIGQRVHSRKAGIIASLAFSAYGMLTFYDLKILSETLSVFLHVLLVFCLLRRPSMRNRVLSGVVLGLLILCRPYAILFIPFAAMYVFLCADPVAWRRKVRAVFALLVPAVLLVCCATARNYYVGRDLVLVCSNGGENFYVGNHKDANGLFVHAAGMGSVRGQGRDVKAEAEKVVGHPMTPSEASRFWFRQGLSFMVDHPGHAMLLLGKKLRYFFSGAEHSSMYYMGFERRLFTPTLGLLFVNFYLVAPFALVGLVVSVSWWRRLFLLYSMMVLNALNTLIFFYDVRFRLPLLPFAMLFGAFGALHLYDVVRRDGRRCLRRASVILFLVVALGMAWVHRLDASHPDDVSSHLYTAVGDAYYRKGQYDRANEAYQKAHQLNPKFPLPVFSMIKVAFARGKKDVAAQMYTKYFPDLGEHFGKVILDDPDFDAVRAYIASGHAGQPR